MFTRKDYFTVQSFLPSIYDLNDRKYAWYFWYYDQGFAQIFDNRGFIWPPLAMPVKQTIKVVYLLLTRVRQ